MRRANEEAPHLRRGKKEVPHLRRAKEEVPHRQCAKKEVRFWNTWQHGTKAMVETVKLPAVCEEGGALVEQLAARNEGYGRNGKTEM